MSFAHHLLLSGPLPVTGSRALTMARAIWIGLLQGVTELFPISSLGHSVLVPGWLKWHGIVGAQSQDESFYLAFLVGLHVATAIALLIFYWKQWQEVIPAAFRLLRTRKISDANERLAWLLIIATIPAGLTGVLLEHTLRTIFAKPKYAAIFLCVNGLILLGGEWIRRRPEVRSLVNRAPRQGGEPGRRIDDMTWKEALFIGVAQIGALFAGISRSGITIVAGLVRGLDHEDAARFSFMLATPIIFAAGVYKLPDLFGSLGDGIRGQVVAGSIAAGIAAFIAVRFLTRFFRSNNLVPFAVYCLLAGAISIVKFA
jgi:undecaprenyl-diphosphatase